MSAPNELHSLLRRQLKRHMIDPGEHADACQAFVRAVDEAYRQFDVDRKMLERSLELSSQELLAANSEMAALFRALPDLLLRLDPYGKILSCKTGHAEHPPFDPAHADGRSVLDLVPTAAAVRFATAIERVIAGQSPESFVFARPGPDGERHYEVRVVPLPEPQVVAIIRDVSEQHRLEEQVRHAQRMDAFGQLAGGVAHDFNNLLTVIMGHLAQLRAAESTEEERAAHVGAAQRAAERAANLTRQLLTFGRRQPIKRVEADLNEVVAGMTKMLQRLIGEHIGMEARYAAGEALVAADIGMLEQVLMNLVINSRDAMPAGGEVTIETRLVVFDALAVGERPELRREGAFIRLSVADTGCGISEENLPRIFEPFFTTKEIGKGTGLGLAIVFGIIEQHDGWIEVHSEVGQGTRFDIFLPRVTPRPAAPVPALAAAPVPRGRETVLLVEDDAGVRELMQALLQRFGYRVLVAESGVAALEAWRAHQAAIDLLVTDMVMPGGISGYELSRRLLAEKPALKVLHCTGYSDEIVGWAAELRAAVEVLEKPFLPNQFLHRVRAVLDRD